MNEHPQFPNVYLLPQTNLLKAIFTKIRRKEASAGEFVQNSRWIMRQLVDYSLNLLNYQEQNIKTPIGAIYNGLQWDTEKICAVSIIRAGDSIEASMREVLPDIEFGKILIQRDKQTKMPHYHYKNLPSRIKNCQLFLMDPMLATGGTAKMAIDLLIKEGVKEENIIFVNLLTVAVGIKAVHDRYPKVKIVSASIEEELNDNAYMIPGIGDFGDRFYGAVYHLG